jgi:hypothetical protein
MAESPPFNHLYYTSARPEDVMNYLSVIRAPGWVGRPGGPQTIIWTHRYMSTPVLVVGVILLVTTLIGGLLLLARSEESLAAAVFIEGGRTKVILSGAADRYMAAAVFNTLNQLPPA